MLLLSSTLSRKEWLIGRSAVLCFVIRAGEWEGSNRRLCASAYAGVLVWTRLRRRDGFSLALPRCGWFFRLLRGGGRSGAPRAPGRRRRRRALRGCAPDRRQHSREACRRSIGRSGLRCSGAVPRVRRVSPAGRALRRRPRSDGRRGRGRAPGGRGPLDRRALGAPLSPR